MLRALRGARLLEGIAYGVLFPFAALNHPADPIGGTPFGFDPDNQGDASTAHTIQMRAMLKF